MGIPYGIKNSFSAKLIMQNLRELTLLHEAKLSRLADSLFFWGEEIHRSPLRNLKRAQVRLMFGESTPLLRKGCKIMAD